jgi:hypothetical protein
MQLIARGGLHIALAGRTAEADADAGYLTSAAGPTAAASGAGSLEPLLAFLARHVTDTRYARLLIDVANCE